MLFGNAYLVCGSRSRLGPFLPDWPGPCRFARGSVTVATLRDHEGSLLPKVTISREGATDLASRAAKPARSPLRRQSAPIAGDALERHLLRNAQTNGSLIHLRVHYILLGKDSSGSEPGSFARRVQAQWTGGDGTLVRSACTEGLFGEDAEGVGRPWHSYGL